MQADALFNADPEWAAPILWRSEFRSLLAGYLSRETLAFDEAVTARFTAAAAPP